MRTAVLYCEYGSRASYYDDWRDAFVNAPAFDTTTFNIAVGGPRDDFVRRVGEFDLIAMLHSVNADHLLYANMIVGALQSRKGKLFSFVGNEVNLPGAPMAPKIDYLTRINTDVIGTQLLAEAGAFLYAGTGARAAAVPHALNPEAFRPGPLDNRPIDIGLRSFRYPSVFLGDDDRNRLIDHFNTHGAGMNLALDLSTESRMDRAEWAAFLNASKATVSNEAGGYWIERDDATLNAITAWLKERSSGGITISSNSWLRRLAHMLPWSVRQALVKRLKSGLIRHELLIGDEEDFDEVRRLFFDPRPFPPEVSGKCISSRHFDAIGTMTCQIMIEGRYNDILRADEHYIPIKVDLSDVDQAVARMRDDTARKAMVRRTHEYVMAEHTHAHRMAQIAELVS